MALTPRQLGLYLEKMNDRYQQQLGEAGRGDIVPLEDWRGNSGRVNS